MLRRMVYLGCFLTLVGPASAQEKKAEPARVKEAMEKVERDLAKRGGPKATTLLWKDAKATVATFPEHVFIVARYRIYPVAMALPEGLHPSNIFAVSDKGTVEHLPNTRELEKFFGLRIKAFLTEQKVKDGLAAWLDLTQEFHQDGFFKFEVLEKDIGVEKKGEDFTARGRALVVGGGNGEIAATAQFSRGVLMNVKETTKIIPGPRPICQASKLLDVDPIVRRMAEQDLLYMGLAAQGYMMEQRAKAGPDLRQAIDRLWERMLKNGW